MPGVPALLRSSTTLVVALVAVALIALPAAAAATTVAVPIGSDLQGLVNTNPPGTTFLIASGVHREQQVVPKDGNVFLGEDGAVLSGARILQGWERTGSSWSVGGQEQQGLVHGTVLPGHESARHPEDLWVDGQWLTKVLSPQELHDGSWYFDYEADRIHLAFDPSGRVVETSTRAFAFAGNGVSDVTIRNVTITRYATPAQGGAIGGHWNERDTRGWLVDRVTAVENHAYGILVGPGMEVTASRAAYNGQGGIGGSGTAQDGYTAPVVVRDSEIANNLVLGFDWWGEGGGTKFSLMSAMKFANNHVHHNGGPGVWFDMANRGATIVDNLIEQNDAQGIFYEISSGGHFARNVVRGNSVAPRGFPAAAIDISQSSETVVEGNLIYDTAVGILIRHDGNRSAEGRAADITVRNNDVTLPADGLHGMIVENTSAAEALQLWDAEGNTSSANTIRIPAEGAQVLTWGTNFWPRQSSWRFDDVVTTDVAHPLSLSGHRNATGYGAAETGSVQAGDEAPAPDGAPPGHFVRR